MTSKDTTAPKLISTTPQKGDTAIPVNQDLVLTFNEEIKVGTGAITLSSGNGDKRVIPISSSELNVAGQALTINPAKDLLSDSHYTVKIDNTAIKDTSGNKYAGIKNTTTFYFDTVDLAPTITKSSPAVNGSNIASNANIVFTFNEKIQAGMGTITLSSGSDVRTIAISDNKQVKISGTTLTINPTVDLNVNSVYKVHLDAGAIKDLAPISHGATAIDLSFTTKASGDKQAPVLQFGEGQFVNEKLQLTFQEAILKGKSGSFTLVNLADKNDKFDIAISDASISQQNQNVLTLESPKIKPEKTYIITAPKGIVTDLAKNAFAGLTTKAAVKFDTHDTTHPTLEISGTKATATNSPITYTFTASEAIKGFTADAITVTGGTKGEFKAIAGTNNYTLSVTPDARSTTPVTVNVAAGKFTDLVNNANLVTATSTPQDVDTKAPQLTSISPLDNGINIAKSSNIVLSFDEKVIAGTGNLVISNGTDTQTISVTDSSQITISDKILTINPAHDLLENSNYTVTIGSGVIADSMGNAFTGLTSHFKTIVPDVVLTAKAIDGYLKSANVYADANGNGKQDPDEVSAITDENGNFKLVNAKGPINISGGTDLSTGKPFAGTLKAPEGSTVVTPLTSVQQGFIEAGQTPDQAEQSVAKAFGFDASKVDLTTYDPIAEVVKAGTTSAMSSIAAQMMASSAQIANFMVTAGQVLQGAAGGSGNLSTQNAGNALIKSLVSAAKTGDGVIKLGDAALLKSVLVEGAKEANAQAQKEAQATGTTAPKFDAANFTDKIDKMADTVTAVLKSAADNIVIAVNNSKGGDALALLSNMDKVSAFAQNDAGASLQKIATTLDTKDANALTATLKSQSDLFTGDAATKSIESKVVETEKAVKAVPVDPTPKPVDPTPKPVDPTPKPVDPTPKPVDPTPKPVDPTPTPLQDITPPTVSVTTEIIKNTANAHVQSNESGTVYVVNTSITVTSLSSITGAADASWNSISVSANTSTNLPATGLSEGTYKAYAVDASGNLSSASSNTLTINAGSNVTISDTGSSATTLGTDIYTVLAGNYTYIINTALGNGFNGGDSLNFFPNAVMNLINDTNQTDGIQELTATNSSTNQAVTLKLTGLSNDQDAAIFNVPSLNTAFGVANLVNLNNTGASGVDIFNIIPGNYNLTITGFSVGDKLNIFSGAVLNIINDINQTDGTQVFTATDPVSGSEAIISLTGLTNAQDIGLFNMPSFATVFGAGTIVQ